MSMSSAYRFLRRIARPSRLVADRRGATAVEYAMILAVIVLVMLVALSQLATSTNAMWNVISTRVTTAR